MPLDAEGQAVGSLNTLQAPIEQRAMGRSDRGGQGRFVNGKPMILAGDEDSTGIDLQDRMIGAMMTKLHLQRLRTTGQP